MQELEMVSLNNVDPIKAKRLARIAGVLYLFVGIFAVAEIWTVLYLLFVGIKPDVNKTT